MEEVLKSEILISAVNR